MYEHQILHEIAADGLRKRDLTEFELLNFIQAAEANGYLHFSDETKAELFNQTPTNQDQ